MPVYLKDNIKVLFVHIPKCGGSSFSERMTGRGWREVLSIKGIHAERLNFLYCSLQHMHASKLKQMVHPCKFDNILTLVRNPVNRLKSEYTWQVRQGMTNLAPRKWINRVFSEYEKNNFVFDNHIRPQHEFLLDSSLIFKLEEGGVSQAVEAVSSKPPERGFFESLFNKDKKNLKKTNKSLSVNKAFRNNRSKIQNFYSDDYAILNYEMKDRE